MGTHIHAAPHGGGGESFEKKCDRGMILKRCVNVIYASFLKGISFKQNVISLTAQTVVAENVNDNS